MTDDLELGPRLERLADELTRDAVTPPVTAAQRHGRRRRRRQLAGGGMLAIALVGLVAWPGVGLLDRGLPSVAPVAPAPAPERSIPTVRPRPLRPPHAAPGQSAVVIQDPPLSLPAKMHTWLTECKEVKFGNKGGHEFEVPSFTIERGNQRISWYVYPLGPVGSTRYKGPWANVQVWTEDPGHPRDPGSFPFVEVYGPQVRVHLDKPNGRKGTIIGPYSVVQEVTTAQGTVYNTLARPTGAQVAIAWNCDAPPGTVPP
jgi:hypothetical protein